MGSMFKQLYGPKVKEIEERFDKPLEDVLKDFDKLGYRMIRQADILSVSRQLVLEWRKKLYARRWHNKKA